MPIARCRLRAPTPPSLGTRAEGVLMRRYSIAVLVVLVAAPAIAFKSDHAQYPPPATGSLAYNAFVPAAAPGSSYVDPVFGETVRRLTSDHVRDDIYARNMWWSADERRYLHRTVG